MEAVPLCVPVNIDLDSVAFNGVSNSPVGVAKAADGARGATTAGDAVPPNAVVKPSPPNSVVAVAAVMEEAGDPEKMNPGVQANPKSLDSWSISSLSVMP